jgi:hypothetical protein
MMVEGATGGFREGAHLEGGRPMGILRNILGPASKYDRRLPYDYEASVAVAGVPGMVDHYFCDTLCGLLERLADECIDLSEVTIVENHQDGPMPILVEHCVDAEGKWLRRPEACRSFALHYPGHERAGRCCYRDRSRESVGTFMEYDPPAAQHR